MIEVRRDLGISVAMQAVTECAKRLRKSRQWDRSVGFEWRQIGRDRWAAYDDHFFEDGRATVDLMALCNHADANVGAEARRILDALVASQPIPFVEQPIAA